jgi:hypothetical protein
MTGATVMSSGTTLRWRKKMARRTRSLLTISDGNWERWRSRKRPGTRAMGANLRLGVRVSKINCFWAPNPHFDLASSSGSRGYIANSLFSSRFVHEPCKNAQNARFGPFSKSSGRQ